MGLIYVAQFTNYALANYLPVIQLPKNTIEKRRISTLYLLAKIDYF
jgi:hypothetical protein